MDDGPAAGVAGHVSMANFPAQQNGGDNSADESDALIIDEQAHADDDDGAPTPATDHSNPYFSQSLVELSRQHRRRSGRFGDYAQYLGLQPSVQFKCSKCSQSGFESLTALNAHLALCAALNHQYSDNTVACSAQNISQGFRLTRKVFLCSACGTYYENWNLYVHMLEFHRRYICLYCLGMFSLLEDLCQHIENKHNLAPGHKNTPAEFFSAYQDPCYVVCVECSALFSETDDFFYHDCVGQKQVHVTANDTKMTEPPQDTAPATVEAEAVEEAEPHLSSPPEETRKVPKLSLKLPKAPFVQPEPDDEEDDEDEDQEHTTNDDTNDSDKLTMMDEPLEPEEPPETQKEPEEEPKADIVEPIQEAPQFEASLSPRIAGPDVPIIELQLEQPLDKFEPELLLKKCLSETIPTCAFCNHARKIHVNGRQLALHAIAEHRFSAVVNSITAEELIPESFVARLKTTLPELESVYFNLGETVQVSHLFECFQCRYSTAVHKELYLHNRKLHAKNLLLCIMCKANFFSYSELLCHLCPGEYGTDSDPSFRCCLCTSPDLPSAFRLLVHLRKKHNVCDVCLEPCHTQYRLSNHVWKHKLHHFCYRCGIAYRNKPDITRHLFWKHGTESVLCKRCLQKKWPHVYHFCVPPATFTCDDCTQVFGSAVALRVHRRLHSDTKPHACTFPECEETFISKPLLRKHALRHEEPEPEPEKEPEVEEKPEELKAEEVLKEEEPIAATEVVEEKPKPKVDVYDLPELNLSESDSSSDSEAEKDDKKQTLNTSTSETTNLHNDELIPCESDSKPVVLENIWDNFKNYQAELDKLAKPETEDEEPLPKIEPRLSPELALRDHDYCAVKKDIGIVEVKPDLTQTDKMDHDYCSPKSDKIALVLPPRFTPPLPPINDKSLTEMTVDLSKSPRKRGNSSSSDSSDSSSSCSCGSNCSCSSSSGSSSSTTESSDSDSSTEEGRRRQKERREKRRARRKDQENKHIDVENGTEPVLPVPQETPILESDLYTTESETDEEFYDEKPHLMAKKILEEKRLQLLAEAGTAPTTNGGFIESTSRPPTPPEDATIPKKKKSKSKKRKKKKSHHRSEPLEATIAPVVAPITLTLCTSPMATPTGPPLDHRRDSTDSNLRLSKRRRVPNKFYGYSSDEEDKDKPKWRKTDTTTPSATPRSPLVVPPITIRTVPQAAPVVEPISIRPGAHPGEMRIHPKKPPVVPPPPPKDSSATDSNESDEEVASVAPHVGPPAPPRGGPNQPQLYCYCRCPYDEVSEMIGCDSSECAIEWFHFECVGIMVPPKGQWFCPDCRKKKQLRRELLAHT